MDTKSIEAKPFILTLDDMIKAGNFDVDPEIDEKNFPVKPERFTVKGAQIVQIGRVVGLTEAVTELDRRGLRPATIEELLAFGAENREEKPRYSPIVAVGTTWVDKHDHRRVPALGEGGLGASRTRYGYVYLDWDIGYQEYYRFLAVIKSDT